MKTKIANLIDVKSIITIMFGAVFSGLAIVGRISEDSFMTVFVMIMTYYFAKNKSRIPHITTKGGMVIWMIE